MELYTIAIRALLAVLVPTVFVVLRRAALDYVRAYWRGQQMLVRLHELEIL